MKEEENTVNAEKYNELSKKIRNSKIGYKIFKLLYRVLPVITMIIYGIMVISVFLYDDREQTVRIILVPLITFIICTLVRKSVNEKRPYEAYDIVPVIRKDKVGQSFPSRHVLSATIIAMTALYINLPLGVVMFIISLCIAIIRPMAGVHYIRDVIAGMLLGIICGIVGFYII